MGDSDFGTPSFGNKILVVLEKFFMLLPKEMGPSGRNLSDSLKDLLAPGKLLNLR
jgi:hypothetical protein